MVKYVIVPTEQGQSTRKKLVEHNVFHTGHKIVSYKDTCLALPVHDDADSDNIGNIIGHKPNLVKDTDVKVQDKRENSSPAQILKTGCSQIFNDNLPSFFNEELPQHWEIHGDLALFHYPALRSQQWQATFTFICNTLRVRRLAVKGAITDDDYRSPRTEILYVQPPLSILNTWVSRVENGIAYEWDLSRSMFSTGNISEKIRLSKIDCRGETVVDLFAGIGYFSLTFLIHCNANFLHACEWNPAAIEALKKNIARNRICSDKVEIHAGDNRQHCPKDVADRINMGLIPTAQSSYETAVNALKAEGKGILHIHGNVDTKESIEPDSTQTEWQTEASRFQRSWQTWANLTAVQIKRLYTKKHGSCRVTILALNKIKSYGPKVDHLVLDLKCERIIEDTPPIGQ